VKEPPRKKRPPRVTARGHLIRDAPERFQVVPNFEDVLGRLQNNKAEIGLPVRTVFVGAQMLATQALLAQPGVLGRSALSPDQSMTGLPGPSGPPGNTGATGATGAAGAPAAPPAPAGPPPPPGGSASSDDPMGSSQQVRQPAPSANALASLPGPTPTTPPDSGVEALAATVADMNRGLMEAERNRLRARQIELADEASYHRVKDDQMARMTAFNGEMLKALVDRPQSVPAALSPPMVSNITNVQNITPTSYFENNVQNLYQTTHNLHQNSLNFINNTSVRMLNMFGLGTPGERSEGEALQYITNGGAPPPQPPGAGAARIAIQDGSVYPSTPVDPLPAPPAQPTPPLAIRDGEVRKMKKVKKPELKPKIKLDPPTVPKQPTVILDPPPRKKPRKADEILRILDGITDSEPKRAKRAIADIPRPQHNRLRIVTRVKKKPDRFRPKASRVDEPQQKNLAIVKNSRWRAT